MPAREVQSPNDVGATLLRRHKVLPHPQSEPLSPHDSKNTNSKPRNLKLNTSLLLDQSRPKVESTGSPTSKPHPNTSPHTLKHTTKRLQPSALPPTPPRHSRESSTASSNNVPKQREDLPANASVASPSTPSHQRSPPTPDVTPPKASRPIALRPPTSDRYPSSARTDSFKTARETPYASEEDEQSTIRPTLHSSRPSQNSQRPSDTSTQRIVGLGLGLETDTESVTTPRTVVHDDFNSFDGEWGSGNGEFSEVEREWDDNLMRNVTVRKRREDEPQVITPRQSKQEVINDREISPSNAIRALRGQTLPERVIKHRRDRDLTDRTSREDLTPRAGSSVAKDPESPSTPTSAEKRSSRMSSRSATSTIVEVRIIDSLPQRQRTLRHTKKQIGLRSVSAPIEPSARGITSVNNGPRLVRKSSGILKESVPHTPPSMISVTSSKPSVPQSTTQSKPPTARARKDIWENGSIPVVVVPERRSSSKSKTPSLRSTSSRRTQRSASLTSAPVSQSSKVNVGSYFDAPVKRTRARSESVGSSQRTMDFAPRIPTRTSSLSAPTSRNTSRAGSLTAESLKIHNSIQTPHIAIELPPSTQMKELDNGKDEHRDGAERTSSQSGQRLSAQMTPFSNVSYATTGTPVSISEAELVTMHQHQNKSVTVVDHSTSSNNSPVDALPVPGAANDASLPPEPHTPENPQNPIAGDENSPLRFPRQAPKPPAIKVILATPAAMTPSAEENRQLGYDYNSPLAPSPPEPRQSMLRRALGGKRGSDSIIPSGLWRTFSKKAEVEKPTGEGDGEEDVWVDAEKPNEPGRLHPFWQPGGFWDGVDVDADEGQVRDSVKRSGSWKRTFAILPIREEGSGSAPRGQGVRRSDSGAKRGVANGNGNGASKSNIAARRGNASASSSSLAVRRKGTIPGLGLRWEYVGIRGLWRGMRERKMERRVERRRKELRGRIGRPRLVNGGWI